MAKIYDAARLDVAASAIAGELRAELAKPRPRLTAGETALAKLKALHLVGLETVDELAAMAREPPAVRRLERRVDGIDDEGEPDVERA
jgi:hypothetical protein